MRRRTLLSACGLAVAGLGGCLSGSGGGSPSHSPTGRSPAHSPTGSGTPTVARQRTRTPVSTNDRAARNPDADHEIRLENRDSAPHVVDLTVTGPDGGVVHESTTDLAPGERVLAFDLSRADPDGVETYDVVAELGDQRQGAIVRTSKCYGDVVVSVTDEGELNVVYTIC